MRAGGWGTLDTKKAGGGDMARAHPKVPRRDFLRVGGLGLGGLGLADLLRHEAAAGASGAAARSVIYLFQSGGPAQHETFDLKPDAPSTIRGEFRPIDTATPGLRICEHLPKLAARSKKFALLRSFSHGSNDHMLGHHIMQTGYDSMPVGFDPTRPTSHDWPSFGAVVNYSLRARASAIPPAVILPLYLVHRTGVVVPGQLGGRMDAKHDPMVLNVAPECSGGYGACPQCFHFENLNFTHKGEPTADFTAPGLDLPPGLTIRRVGGRAELLRTVEAFRRGFDRHAETAAAVDRFRGQALSILTSERTASAFDVHREDPRTLDRYGRGQFGRSLVLARRLVEAGVRLVQVNLGANETWDTHQSAWPVLKDKLLPPLDQALSALLDDLDARGRLDSTLIVMGGEFGRTPRISTLPGAKLAGRDHWGRAQTLWFAGGGVAGGTTDRVGGAPTTQPFRPSDLAATIYHVLGLGANPEFRDRLGRPFAATVGTPIAPLFA